MANFKITGEIKIAGPNAKDLNAAASEIRKQLQSINQTIKIDIDLASAKAGVKELNKDISSLATSIGALKVGNLNALATAIGAIATNAQKLQYIDGVIASFGKNSGVFATLPAQVEATTKALEGLNNTNLNRIKKELGELAPILKNVSRYSKGVEFGTTGAATGISGLSTLQYQDITEGMSKLTAAAKNLKSPMASIGFSAEKINQNLNGAAVGISNTSTTLTGATQAYQQAANAVSVGGTKITNSIKQTNKDVVGLIDGFVSGVQTRFSSFLKFAIASFLVDLGRQAVTVGTQAVLGLDETKVKLRQITGESRKDINELSKDVLKLGKNIGISSGELLRSAETLGQAGFTLKSIKGLLETVSFTELAPTFASPEKTTEGIIAIKGQFKFDEADLGRQITKALSSINTLAKKYAVESGDIIEAVKTTGSVFAATEGITESSSDDEKQDALRRYGALVTSVRSNTRLPQAVISTGFRTILQRLQRPSTEGELQNLFGEDFSLRDAQGEFVGTFEAIERINKELEGFSTQSKKFAQTIQALGGDRQSKVAIPLILGIGDAYKALSDAREADNSLAEDAELAQESLNNKLQKVQQTIIGFATNIFESQGFRQFIDFTIQATNATIAFANALRPLLPLIEALAVIKIGSTLLSNNSLVGLGGLVGRKLIGRNTGGMIPSNVRLTPGEFVIDPTTARSMGYGKLDQINFSGKVPGSGNTDSVLANVAPGSYVLNKKTTERYLPGYAFGGLVAGSRVEVPPRTQDIKGFMAKAQRELGVEIALYRDKDGKRYMAAGTSKTQVPIPASARSVIAHTHPDPNQTELSKIDRTTLAKRNAFNNTNYRSTALVTDPQFAGLRASGDTSFVRLNRRSYNFSGFQRDSNGATSPELIALSKEKAATNKELERIVERRNRTINSFTSSNFTKASNLVNVVKALQDKESKIIDQIKLKDKAVNAANNEIAKKRVDYYKDLEKQRVNVLKKLAVAKKGTADYKNAKYAFSAINTEIDQIKKTGTSTGLDQYLVPSVVNKNILKNQLDELVEKRVRTQRSTQRALNKYNTTRYAIDNAGFLTSSSISEYERGNKALPPSVRQKELSNKSYILDSQILAARAAGGINPRGVLAYEGLNQARANLSSSAAGFSQSNSVYQLAKQLNDRSFITGVMSPALAAAITTSNQYPNPKTGALPISDKDRAAAEAFLKAQKSFRDASAVFARTMRKDVSGAIIDTSKNIQRYIGNGFKLNANQTHLVSDYKPGIIRSSANYLGAGVLSFGRGIGNVANQFLYPPQKVLTEEQQKEEDKKQEIKNARAQATQRTTGLVNNIGFIGGALSYSYLTSQNKRDRDFGERLTAATGGAVIAGNAAAGLSPFLGAAGPYAPLVGAAIGGAAFYNNAVNQQKKKAEIELVKRRVVAAERQRGTFDINTSYQDFANNAGRIASATSSVFALENKSDLAPSRGGIGQLFGDVLSSSTPINDALGAYIDILGYGDSRAAGVGYSSGETFAKFARQRLKTRQKALSDQRTESSVARLGFLTDPIYNQKRDRDRSKTLSERVDRLGFYDNLSESGTLTLQQSLDRDADLRRYQQEDIAFNNQSIIPKFLDSISLKDSTRIRGYSETLLKARRREKGAALTPDEISATVIEAAERQGRKGFISSTSVDTLDRLRREATTNGERQFSRAKLLNRTVADSEDIGLDTRNFRNVSNIIGAASSERDLLQQNILDARNQVTTGALGGFNTNYQDIISNIGAYNANDARKSLPSVFRGGFLGGAFDEIATIENARKEFATKFNEGIKVKGRDASSVADDVLSQLTSGSLKDSKGGSFAFIRNKIADKITQDDDSEAQFSGKFSAGEIDEIFDTAIKQNQKALQEAAKYIEEGAIKIRDSINEYADVFIKYKNENVTRDIGRLNFGNRLGNLLTGGDRDISGDLANEEIKRLAGTSNALDIQSRLKQSQTIISNIQSNPENIFDKEKQETLKRETIASKIYIEQLNKLADSSAQLDQAFNEIARAQEKQSRGRGIALDALFGGPKGLQQAEEQNQALNALKTGNINFAGLNEKDLGTLQAALNNLKQADPEAAKKAENDLFAQLKSQGFTNPFFNLYNTVGISDLAKNSNNLTDQQKNNIAKIEKDQDIARAALKDLQTNELELLRRGQEALTNSIKNFEQLNEKGFDATIVSEMVNGANIFNEASKRFSDSLNLLDQTKIKLDSNIKIDPIKFSNDGQQQIETIIKKEIQAEIDILRKQLGI